MRLAVVFALCFCSFVYAQKGTNSPFSYYGLGERRFEGNTENALMGGMNAFVDSTRVDVRNPASLGRLARTTFSLSTSYDMRKMTTPASSYNERTFFLDYLSLSFPVYKQVGVSVGLRPYSSIGYKLQSQEQISGREQYFAYEGSGGVNQAYLSVGYEFLQGLRMGLSGGFNFGKSEFENYYSSPSFLYISREESQSLYRGGSYALGLQYDRNLGKEYAFSAGLSYVPEAKLNATNTLTLYSLRPHNGNFLVKDSRTITDPNLVKTKLTLPSSFELSAGGGKPSQWFVGASLHYTQMSAFSNPFVTTSIVTYENAYRFALGGFFLPHNTAYTKYWKRVTYRAGFYYEHTGITLKEQPINDFGITFGVSLPIQGLSNATIGGAWGQKGDNTVLKENYFTLKVALTLSDKWFQRTKYH